MNSRKQLTVTLLSALTVTLAVSACDDGTGPVTARCVDILDRSYAIVADSKCPWPPPTVKPALPPRYIWMFGGEVQADKPAYRDSRVHIPTSVMPAGRTIVTATGRVLWPTDAPTPKPSRTEGQ